MNVVLENWSWIIEVFKLKNDWTSWSLDTVWVHLRTKVWNGNKGYTHLGLAPRQPRRGARGLCSTHRWICVCLSVLGSKRPGPSVHILHVPTCIWSGEIERCGFFVTTDKKPGSREYDDIISDDDRWSKFRKKELSTVVVSTVRFENAKAGRPLTVDGSLVHVSGHIHCHGQTYPVFHRSLSIVITPPKPP